MLKLHPPTPGIRLLDIGCGEGRNAIFFARNGYDVTGFDIAESGIAKAQSWAERLGLSVNLFTADLMAHHLQDDFDIIFSTGTLHYATPELRAGIMQNIKERTQAGGLNAFSVFVEKPFVERAPDAEANAYHWKSGELLGFYHDWLVEFSEEMIFDCNSGGVPHRHAVNRVVARKV